MCRTERTGRVKAWYAAGSRFSGLMNSKRERERECVNTYTDIYMYIAKMNTYIYIGIYLYS